uniref:Uncharacterized protein n=1 Tax=Salix viminalis TaxID=40686 RepID=A0A6N2N3K0_SALVM
MAMTSASSASRQGSSKLGRGGSKMSIAIGRTSGSLKKFKQIEFRSLVFMCEEWAVQDFKFSQGKRSLIYKINFAALPNQSRTREKQSWLLKPAKHKGKDLKKWTYSTSNK